MSMRELSQSQQSRPIALDGPALPSGPRQGETRQPTAAEVKLIQSVFRIDEPGYGARTREAVAKLQMENGISVDAQVSIGPHTWKLVLRVQEEGGRRVPAPEMEPAKSVLQYGVKAAEKVVEGADTAVEGMLGEVEKDAKVIKEVAGGVELGAHVVERGAQIVERGAHMMERGAHVVERGAHVVGRGAHVVERGAHEVERGAHEVEQGAHEVERGAQVVERVAGAVKRLAEVVEKVAETAKQAVGAVKDWAVDKLQKLKFW